MYLSNVIETFYNFGNYTLKIFIKKALEYNPIKFN